MIGYCWAFECSLIRWYWIVCSILVRIDKPRKPEKLKKPIRKVQNCQKKSCQWTAGETESVPCSLSRSNWATPRSKIRPELRLTMRQGPNGPFLSPRVFRETSSISSSFMCVCHIVGHSRVTYVQLGRVCVRNGSARVLILISQFTTVDRDDDPHWDRPKALGREWETKNGEKRQKALWREEEHGQGISMLVLLIWLNTDFWSLLNAEINQCYRSVFIVLTMGVKKA